MFSSVSKRILFYWLVLILFPLSVPAQIQNREIDSLQNILKSLKEDTVKVNMLNDIGYRMENIDLEKSEEYYRQALALAEKLIFKKGIAQNTLDIGNCYWSKGNYPEAIQYFLRSLKLFEEINHQPGIATSYMNIGNVYYYQRNYNKAIAYYSQAVTLYEKLGARKLLAGVLGNLGGVYSDLGNYEKSIAYLQMTLKMCEELNDSLGIASAYNNLGGAYYQSKNYEKANSYWLLALKLKEELNDESTIASALINLGTINNEQGNYEQALEYAQRALSIGKEFGAKEKIKLAYELLSQIYFRRGNYRQAYEYKEFFIQVNDSLLNEESARQVTEMNTKYETEKKESQIKIQHLQISEQNLELNKKQITIYAAAGGIFLLLLLSFFIFRSYRLKQKSNVLLAEKNILIEAQKKLVEEKNSDITASIEYAKRIQQAILPLKEKIREALPESFILFMPKDIVSGDFYWFAETTGTDFKSVLLAAADCTGHGVPGAFMSMIGTNTLTKIVSEQKITQPAEILNHLNNEIKFALKQKSDYESSKDGMDIAIVKFQISNLPTGQAGFKFQIEYAGANRQLIYFEKGELTEITPDKTAIGGYTDDSYIFTNHSIELKKDTMVYFFSDGYADQFGGPKGKKFMLRNLKELFKNIKNLPVKEQETTLRNAFESWKGNQDQVDDICIIGVRV